MDGHKAKRKANIVRARTHYRDCYVGRGSTNSLMRYTLGPNTERAHWSLLYLYYTLIRYSTGYSQRIYHVCPCCACSFAPYINRDLGLYTLKDSTDEIVDVRVIIIITETSPNSLPSGFEFRDIDYDLWLAI